ncbi:MAG: hypothetical protein ACSHWP_00185 [Pseudoalteromonas sp.]
MEFPHAWVIIVDSENKLLRIFAQYRADGFTAGMHSRVSSGFYLKDVKECGDEYVITQQSGTTYNLRKADEGTGDSFMRSELNNILSQNKFFSTTKISLEQSKEQVSVEALENELVAFFENTDDMNEWLSFYVPGLESKPRDLMSSSEGRRRILACIECMKYGDFP